MARMKQRYPTVRISAESHKKLRELADEEQIPMSEVVERAIERYRRERFHQQAGEVWTRMMEDPEAARFWTEEDALLEGTLEDGLLDDHE